jgi:hypothetical protein
MLARAIMHAPTRNVHSFEQRNASTVVISVASARDPPPIYPGHTLTEHTASMLSQAGRVAAAALLLALAAGARGDAIVDCPPPPRGAVKFKRP